MQAHDTVAVQETAEEKETQYLGETVKLVRLEKALDTPLVRHHHQSFSDTSLDRVLSSLNIFSRTL